MICEEKINECLTSLINVAKDICWNDFSSQNKFIISEGTRNVPDFSAFRRIRKQANNKKNPVSLSEIITDLNRIYDTIYEIDFYIYRAERKRTIIEVQYFSKDSVAHGGYINDILPMIRCKVAIPPYYEDDKQKFDVNWEHDPFLHQWKMFWWRRKIKYLLMGHDRKSDFSN